MLWITFGLYTAFAATLWVMLFVARMHAYKFKNYSFHIEPVTKILMIALTMLTLLGYWFVFTIDSSESTIGQTLRETTSGRTF
ncbi:MAG TPA: hypothetical protein PK765_06690 [bacterium]|nr:hypothetical protein [bacterium]